MSVSLQKFTIGETKKNRVIEHYVGICAELDKHMPLLESSALGMRLENNDLKALQKVFSIVL